MKVMISNTLSEYEDICMELEKRDIEIVHTIQ